MLNPYFDPFLSSKIVLCILRCSCVILYQNTKKRLCSYMLRYQSLIHVTIDDVEKCRGRAEFHDWFKHQKYDKACTFSLKLWILIPISKQEKYQYQSYVFIMYHLISVYFNGSQFPSSISNLKVKLQL